MCATAYKSSVIVFGGVADQDDGGTNLSSVFFNDVYSFDVPKRQVQTSPNQTKLFTLSASVQRP